MSLFKKISGLKPRKHYFNLSYDNKFTCDIGQLIPELMEECLPGDRFKISVESVIRLQPMVAPILQTLDVRFEAFFVPTRILDENWEDFITGGKDGNNNYSLPLMDYYYVLDQTPSKYSLWDYFGLPLVKSNLTSDPDKESLPIKYPFMAYNLIYNEYYRDENVMDEVDLGNPNVLNRCWSKDYFTSALPFQQRGTSPAFHWVFDDIFDGAHAEWSGSFLPVASISNTTNIDQYTIDRQLLSPLGTNSLNANRYGFAQTASNVDFSGGNWQGDWLNLYHLSGDGQSFENRYTTGIYNSELGHSIVSRSELIGTSGADAPLRGIPVGSGNAGSFYSYKASGGIPPEAGIYGHKSNYLNNNSIKGGATIELGFDITELRQNFQLQKYLERNMRSGYRYNEQLYARFGVRSADSRLQRPEFLGSSKSTIMISEIPQTSASDSEAGTTPQGTLAGKGLGASLAKSLINYRCPEHGYIIVNFSLVPKTSYNAQGVNKKWLRRTKFDFYTPEFAHLSETQVLRREIFYTGDPASDLQVFGYQGIYDEYRHNRSIVSSDFRDKFSYWHMARTFSNAPVLNADFLTIDPESSYLKAPFAVQNEKNFLVDCANVIHSVRPLPSIAEPGLVDHF